MEVAVEREDPGQPTQWVCEHRPEHEHAAGALGAARDLRRAGKRVLVVEARKRVGGRCRSRRIAGASDVANLGATFAGPGSGWWCPIRPRSDAGSTGFEPYSDTSRNPERSTDFHSSSRAGCGRSPR